MAWQPPAQKALDENQASVVSFTGPATMAPTITATTMAINDKRRRHLRHCSGSESVPHCRVSVPSSLEVGHRACPTARRTPCKPATGHLPAKQTARAIQRLLETADHTPGTEPVGVWFRRATSSLRLPQYRPWCQYPSSAGTKRGGNGSSHYRRARRSQRYTRRPA